MKAFFFDDVVHIAEEVNIDEPQLPHYRRVPMRLDEGSQPHRYDSPKRLLPPSVL